MKEYDSVFKKSGKFIIKMQGSFEITKLILFGILIIKTNSQEINTGKTRLKISEPITQRELDIFFEKLKDISGSQIREIRNIEFPEHLERFPLDSGEEAIIQTTLNKLKRFWIKHNFDEFMKCKSVLKELFIPKMKKIRDMKSEMIGESGKSTRTIEEYMDYRELLGLLYLDCKELQDDFVAFVDQYEVLLVDNLEFNLNTCFKFEDELLKCD